jgi:endonuclease/exonuclease/phosphatase family metal-dependent hydrolase
LILNEVDYGMARTDNLHTTKVLAEVLGMNYVFGVEYLELSKGEPHERETPGKNTQSLHGNAILSRFPLANPVLIRLKGLGQWFRHDQKRIGSRIGLIADVEIGEQPIRVATVHLENEADPDFRKEQFDQLISVLHTRNHSEKHIIAGDLNTSTLYFPGEVQRQILLQQGNLGSRFLNPIAYEPLFATLRREGYEIERANDMSKPTAFMKSFHQEGVRLDWIFTKDLPICQSHHSPAVVPLTELEYRNRPVADHNALLLKITARGLER